MPPPDPTSAAGSADDDPSLDRVIALVVEAAEANDTGRVEGIIRDHPSHENALRQFLATHGALEGLFAPLRAPFGGFAAEPPTPLAPGRRLGDFELLRELARGGMGIVYLARQARLDRLVALKTIQVSDKGAEAGGGAGASPEQVERFRREAAAAARLRHPHIVSVFGAGQADGIHYLAMEYVEGESLAARIQARPLGIRAAAELTRKVAEAVELAHGAGIVHRDLKPSNILLDMRGEPRVGDFGLAAFLAEDSDLTTTGALIGTPTYMAPEQAARGKRPCGPATDVHALGVILYELLLGRPPFRRETALETIGAIVGEEPIPPRRICPDIPRDLETICLKCLEKEPGRRYASAGALARDLERFLGNEPILARPVGRLTRILKWGRRRPAAAGLLVASVGLFAAIFALLLVAREALERSRADEERLAAANGELQRAVAAIRQEARNTRYRLYGQEMRDAFEAAAKGDTDQLQQRLANWNSPENDADDDPRGLEWHLLANAGYPGERILASNAGPVLDIECSPDGQSVATGAADGTIRVWRVADGGAVAHWLAHEGGVDGLEFLGDDELASIGPGMAPGTSEARIWSLEGTLRRALPPVVGDEGCLAIAPGGTRIAVGVGNHVRIDSVPAGMDAISIRLDGPVENIAFAPDGKLLAIAVQRPGKDGHVELWDLVGPNRRATLGGHEGPVNSVAFSREGTTLATTGWDGRIRLWDREGRMRVTLEGHADKVQSLVFSPVDDRLISCGRDQTIRLWDTSAVALEQEGAVRAIALSGDGRWLACSLEADRGVRVWDVERREPIAALESASPVRALAFSPAGDGLALAGDGLEVWDKASGARTRVPVEDGRRFNAIAHGPEGRTVAATDAAGRATLWWLDAPRPPVTLNNDGQEIQLLATNRLGQVAAGSRDRVRVDLWDSHTGLPLRSLLADDGVHGVALSSDGSRLAIGTANGWIQIVNCRHGSTVARWRAHASPVTRLSIADGDTRIYSADEDGRMRRWDSRTGDGLEPHANGPRVGPGAVLAGNRFAWANGSTVWIGDENRWRAGTTLRGHAGRVWGVAPSPDGKRVFSTGADGTIRAWNVDQASAGQIEVDPPADVACLAPSPDGTAVLTGGSNGVTAIWRLVAGPNGPGARVLSIQNTKVRAVAISPREPLAAVSEGIDVALFDTRKPREVMRLRGHTKEVCGVAFAPDGSRLASAANDGTVRVWNSATGDSEAVLEADPLGVEAVAFSVNGARLASGGHNRAVVLWDAKSFRPLRRFSGHGQTVRSLAFSPDGRWLASGANDRTARLWEIEGDQTKTLRHESSVVALLFTPDGKTLVTGTETAETTFWQVPSWEKMGSITGGGRIEFGPFFGNQGNLLFLPAVGGPNRARVALRGHTLVPLGDATAWIPPGALPAAVDLVVGVGETKVLSPDEILETTFATVGGNLSARGSRTRWINHGRTRVERGAVMIHEGAFVSDHGWTVASDEDSPSPSFAESRGPETRWLSDGTARFAGTGNVELSVLDGAELRIAESLVVDRKVPFRGLVAGSNAYLQVNHIGRIESGELGLADGARARFGGVRIGPAERPSSSGASGCVVGAGSLLEVAGDVTVGRSMAPRETDPSTSSPDHPVHLLAIKDGGALAATGSVTIGHGGILRLEEGTVSAHRLEIQRGRAHGRGTIRGFVQNDGVLTLAAREGVEAGLIVDGDFTQGESGSLQFDDFIDGARPALLIRGRAVLHGRLVWKPSESKDSLPVATDTILLLRAVSIEGEVNLEVLGDAPRSWRLARSRTEIVARRVHSP